MLDALLKYVPKHLHAPYLNLLSNMPDYLVRIAVVGDSCAAAGYLLKKRPGVHVTGVLRDPRLAEVAGQLLDGVARTPAEIAALPDKGLDALLLCNVEDSGGGTLAWLEDLAPRLKDQALVYVLFGEPAFAGDGGSSAGELEQQIEAALNERGFPVYQRWPLVDPLAPTDPPRGALLAAVSMAYNPVLHAGGLLHAGRPDAAYYVLDQIPTPCLENADSRDTVGQMKLDAVAEWIRRTPGQDQSCLLVRALSEFYQRTDDRPRNPAPYLTMAQCWEAVGDHDMALRLLRSIASAAPTAATIEARDRIEALPRVVSAPFDTVPAWDGSRPFRVLYVIHPRPHYGLDVLYDGLCACLGDENVVEYPWKATLHGEDTPEHRHYPCRFNRRGNAATLEAICTALREKAFDFILFGDVEGALPQQEVQAILNARGSCPVFLMDGLDEMGNFRERLLQRLGLSEVAGYFKREMHRCVDYGSDAWPMPFAYSEEPALLTPVENRPHDFFWAGHRRFGLRRLYLEALEARHGWTLNAHYDQAAYQARIRSSRMGLNCFGMGFDTVRYWELPAQGCMLISDRLPIHIPHNFEDGKHAAFFGDLDELLEKVAYYLHHPEETQIIAEAGRQHFMQYHTNRARAGQLLGRVERVLAARTG